MKLVRLIIYDPSQGRGGKGSIYVWATGNGGMYGDNCGADGYVSSIETLSFGSVTDRGTMPYFMERCTSTLGVVPSGGEEVQGEEEAAGIVKIKDVRHPCVRTCPPCSSHTRACVAALTPQVRVLAGAGLAAYAYTICTRYLHDMCM